MADWIRRHSEPRAERTDETEARVASILHQEDCPCTSPVHEADYLDTARIVLSSIEAVPKWELEKAADAWRTAVARAESAESRCKSLEAALEQIAEYGAKYAHRTQHLQSLFLIAHEALGGPDDAPKEPTRCKNPLCRNGTVPDPDDEYGSGNGPYFRVPCPSCGSLPERDR